jgi:hypothetical protein
MVLWKLIEMFSNKIIYWVIILEGLTPRLSNISGAEIYSVQPTPRASNFSDGDIGGAMWGRTDGASQVVMVGPPSPAVVAGVKVVWENCDSDREGQCGKNVGGKYTLLSSLFFLKRKKRFSSRYT